MQHFMCEITNSRYAFDWDVLVEVVDGVYKFSTAEGEELTAIPETLKPCNAPDISTPSLEDISNELRNKRTHSIALTDWFVQRHRDEVDAKIATTMTAKQYKDLLAYRQALRDFPSKKGFPNIDLPKVPNSICLMITGSEPETIND